MECLNPKSITVDVNTIQSTYPALIERVEVRLDGVCKTCLRQQRRGANRETNAGAKLERRR
jgi:Fur family ferric uptake transcriptional regulator